MTHRYQQTLGRFCSEEPGRSHLNHGIQSFNMATSSAAESLCTDESHSLPMPRTKTQNVGPAAQISCHSAQS